MMAPHVYEQFRANAPMHVQLRRSDLGRAAPGRIKGRVLRIFRDDEHRLRWGQRLTFAVPVIDGAGQPMPGGVITLDWRRLDAARWVEAFLEFSGGQIHLVHSQIAAISGPTLAPVCGPEVKGFLCAGNF